MAEYPTYDVSDLAEFSGEDVDAYDRVSFVESALAQATLLFKIGTCLSAFPDDETQGQLAKFAIISMADAIYWAQPWQKMLRTPFSSETIGSYSYSKLSTAVSAGLPTGVSWFDLAISTLSVCGTTGILSGGWNVFEENKEPHGGYGVYLGPADQNPDTWGPDTYTSEDPPGAI